MWWWMVDGCLLLAAPEGGKIAVMDVLVDAVALTTAGAAWVVGWRESSTLDSGALVLVYGVMDDSTIIAWLIF